jgi:hypothetical protein
MAVGGCITGLAISSLGLDKLFWKHRS